MSNRNLSLYNIDGISVGETLLTPQMLEADVQAWSRRTFLVGIGEEYFDISDEALLRVLCFEYMPFKLFGFGKEPILRAEVARFPYSINGKRAYQDFACRLVPESGVITLVEMNENHSLAINYQSVTPRGLKMDLGNGSLHLEVYFSPQKQSHLAPLEPPTGFKENVFGGEAAGL